MDREKRLLLFAAIQVLFVAGSIRAEMAQIGWIASSCFLGIYIVPFIGYIVVLYRAPMRLGASPAARMAVLAMLSAVMTIFGAVAYHVLLGLAGVPVRG